MRSCSRTSVGSMRSRRSISAEPGQAGPRLSPRDQIVSKPMRQDGLESAVRVAVRFRPLGSDEDEDAAAFVVRPDGLTVDSSDLAYSFQFDHAFGGDVGQAQVYDVIGCATVKDVLDGYNGTVLAYGQTGSGKTHCMFGPDLALRDHHGIVPRSARQIFSSILASPSDVRFVLRCSLLELYCEQMRDLLNPSNRDLRVQESAQRGVHVEGLTEECVTCEEEVADILQMGLHMRAVASTRLNQMSSRSHMLFFLSIEHRLPDGSERSAKLSLVDLAGSERVDRSGALSAGGTMLKEAKTINCSLSALGHTIQALSERRPHVPYRNSQLTRVLQETLGGNCKTTLLVACSPSAGHVSETLSSLRFAARARSVCNHVKVNLIHSPEQLTCLVGQLQRELQTLRREATRLGGGRGRGVGTAPQPDGEDIGNDEADEWYEQTPAPLVPAVEADKAVAAAAKVAGLVAELKERDVCAAAARDGLLAAAKAAASAAAAQVATQAQSSPASLQQLPCSSLGVRVAAAKLLSLVERDGGLEWQAAAARYGAKVAEEDLQEWEAIVDRKEEELEEAQARLRTQRVLCRRQEVHSRVSGAGAGECLGDLSCAMTTGRDAETSSMSGRGSRARLRSQRSYLSIGSRKGSKILRPISSRDVELSGTSHSSATSSFCDCSSLTAHSPTGDRVLQDDVEDSLAAALDALDVRQSLLLPRGVIAAPPASLISHVPPVPSALIASASVQVDMCSSSTSTCDSRAGHGSGSSLMPAKAALPILSAGPYGKLNSEQDSGPPASPQANQTLPTSQVRSNSFSDLGPPLVSPQVATLNSDSCSRVKCSSSAGAQPALLAFPVQTSEPNSGAGTGPCYRRGHGLQQLSQVMPAAQFGRCDSGSNLCPGYCPSKSPALVAIPVPADSAHLSSTVYRPAGSPNSGSCTGHSELPTSQFRSAPSSVAVVANSNSGCVASQRTMPAPQPLVAVPVTSLMPSGSSPANISANPSGQGRVVIWTPAAIDDASAVLERPTPAQSREQQLLTEIERQTQQHEAWRQAQSEQDRLRQEDFDRHVEEVQKIFRAAQNAQVCSDSETAHLREQLAHLDESIDEAAAAGDAAELKILRLQRQIDRKQLELEAAVEPMKGVSTEDFEFCLNQVWQTVASMNKSLARGGVPAGGKENEAPVAENGLYRQVLWPEGKKCADTIRALRSVMPCGPSQTKNCAGTD